MKSIFKVLVILFIVSIIGACTDNATNAPAEKMSLEQLAVTPGYTWFSYEIDNYTPKTDVIEQIKQKYDASQHRFVIFAKPSCSCPGKHKQSPEFVKVLENANIPLDKCEIYSMSSINTEHPYKDMINIKVLPTIVVFKVNSPVYSVSDSINIVIDSNPNAGIKIEEALLKGLEK